jgi:ribose transport system ATP-binding protein/D-xylose transport system ATP-binding protein
MSKAVEFEVVGLSKSFGSVKALKNVNIKVESGHIHAIMGQNGAGKSTLVKLLIGVHSTKSASGEIFMQGERVLFVDPSDAIKKGVGYVPQEIELVDNLTVAENIFAGVKNGSLNSFSKKDVEERTREVLDKYGIILPVQALAASLSAAQRQLVMITRALVLNPKILLLDEPTTSLSTTDAQKLVETLLKLRNRGVTMLYITHRIQEVINFCDSATILRDGEVTSSLAKSELKEEDIIFAMIGRNLQTASGSERIHNKQSILKVSHLSAPALNPQSVTLNDVSFELKENEILGLAGLVGSGRSEVLNAIFGRIPSSGEITLDGEVFLPTSPSHARSKGFSLLAEDRKREGLFFNLNIFQNVSAGSMKLFSKRNFVDTHKEKLETGNYLDSLRVKAPEYSILPAQLSGGNQQKILFARVLIEKPRILFLDEPTKGVDIGVRTEIYKIIEQLRSSGTSIIVVSSDLKELLGICDRFVVLSQGTVTDEFISGDGGEARILKASSGLASTTI